MGKTKTLLIWISAAWIYWEKRCLFMRRSWAESSHWTKSRAELLRSFVLAVSYVGKRSQKFCCLIEACDLTAWIQGCTSSRCTPQRCLPNAHFCSLEYFERRAYEVFSNFMKWRNANAFNIQKTAFTWSEISLLQVSDPHSKRLLIGKLFPHLWIW